LRSAPLTIAACSLAAPAAADPHRLRQRVACRNFHPGFEPDVAIDAARPPGAARSTRARPSASRRRRRSSPLTTGRELHLAEATSRRAGTCIGGGDHRAPARPPRSTAAVYFSGPAGVEELLEIDVDRRRALVVDVVQTRSTAPGSIPVDRRRHQRAETAIGAAPKWGGSTRTTTTFNQDTTGTTDGQQIGPERSVDGVQYGSLRGDRPAVAPRPAAVISRGRGDPGQSGRRRQPTSPLLNPCIRVHTSASNRRWRCPTWRGQVGRPPRPAATVANDCCTDPTQVRAGRPGGTSRQRKESADAGQGDYMTGTLFPVDRGRPAGNVYVRVGEYRRTWKDPNNTTTPTGPACSRSPFDRRTQDWRDLSRSRPELGSKRHAVDPAGTRVRIGNRLVRRQADAVGQEGRPGTRSTTAAGTSLRGQRQRCARQTASLCAHACSPNTRRRSATFDAGVGGFA